MGEQFDQNGPASGETSSGEQSGESGLSALRGARVLVVEDTRALRLVLVKILGDLGADVDEAADGEEALAVLRTAAFNGMRHHLIVTDLRMPNMDGYQLLSAVRMDTGLRSVPVIVLTADSDEKMVLQCARQGISSYITKPAKPTAVLEAAQFALAQSPEKSREGKLPAMFEADLKSIAIRAAREAIACGESRAKAPEQDRVVQAVFAWLDTVNSAGSDAA